MSDAQSQQIITFVCTGNTCRSPMAEGYARHLLEQKGDNNIKVQSCGLAVYGAEAPSANAVTAMSEIGVDISGHVSTMINEKILLETDIFYCMTNSHKQMLDQIIASVEQSNNVKLGKKVITLGNGIPDPYGGDLSEYQMTRDAIIKSVDAVL